MDTNIGILQYIKSGQISINIEISNIKSQKEVNINIYQFFMNSPDFQKLNTEIERKKRQLEETKDESRRLHLTEALQNLYELEKEFKIDVLRLANIFSTIAPRTERLKKAVSLFDQGRFKEADAVLVESEMSREQFELIALADYLEIKYRNLS